MAVVICVCFRPSTCVGSGPRPRQEVGSSVSCRTASTKWSGMAMNSPYPRPRYSSAGASVPPPAESVPLVSVGRCSRAATFAPSARRAFWWATSSSTVMRAATLARQPGVMLKAPRLL